MPKFYFNVRKHERLELDSEGADFPTIDAAHEDALQAAREILAEKVLAEEVIDGNCFEITDENGKVVREIPFRSAIHLA